MGKVSDNYELPHTIRRLSYYHSSLARQTTRGAMPTGRNTKTVARSNDTATSQDSRHNERNVLHTGHPLSVEDRKKCVSHCNNAWQRGARSGRATTERYVIQGDHRICLTLPLVMVKKSVTIQHLHIQTLKLHWLTSDVRCIMSKCVDIAWCLNVS